MNSENFYVGKVVWVDQGGIPLPGKIAEPEDPSRDFNKNQDDYFVFLFHSEESNWFPRSCVVPFEWRLHLLKNINDTDYKRAVQKAWYYHNGRSNDSDTSVGSMETDCTLTYSRKKLQKSRHQLENNGDLRVTESPPKKKQRKECDQNEETEVRMPNPYATRMGSRQQKVETIDLETVYFMESHKQKTRSNGPKIHSILKEIAEKQTWNLETQGLPKIPDTFVVLHKLPLPVQQVYEDATCKILIDKKNDNSNEITLKFITDVQSLKFGLLGWHHQGIRIAASLLENGQEVYSYSDILFQWGDLGIVKICKSPAELVKSCDVIFCCLNTASAALKMMSNEEFCNNIQEGKGFVFLTPMQHDCALGLESLISSRHGGYLEISFVQSEMNNMTWDSTLLLAGGSMLFFDVVKLYLSSMAKNIIWLGKQGSVIKVSFVLNTLMGSMLIALSEALALVEDQEHLFSEVWSTHVQDILTPLGFKNNLLVESSAKMLSREKLSSVNYNDIQHLLRHTLQTAHEKSLFMPVANATYRTLLHEKAVCAIKSAERKTTEKQ